MRLGASQSLEPQPSREGGTTVDVTEPDIAFAEVSFNSQNVRNSSIHVARLLGIPSNSDDAAEGEVYQYLQVAFSDADQGDLGNVTIRFAVSEDWLAGGAHEKGDVILLRRTEAWETLPTRIIGETDGAVTYEATSPGLSVFAIAAIASGGPETVDSSDTPSPTAEPTSPTLPLQDTTPVAPVGSPTQTNTPTRTPQPVARPPETPTATPSPPEQSVSIPRPVPRATATPKPLDTATPSPSPTQIPTVEPTPTATGTPTPSVTATDTPTPTPSATPTPTFTPTPTTIPSTPVPTTPPSQQPRPPAPTATSAPVPTSTAAPVSSATPTPTPTATSLPAPTATPTPTNTPVPTETATPVPTPTATPSPAADERYAVVLHSESEYFLSELGVSSYLNFGSGMSKVPAGATKLPFIPVQRDRSVWDSGQAEAIESFSDSEIDALGFFTRQELRDMAESAPGSSWYLFGEANRYGHITGDRFAPVMRYLIKYLKEGDPGAKMVGTSLLNWDFTCLGCPLFVHCSGLSSPQLRGYQCGKDWLGALVEGI